MDNVFEVKAGDKYILILEGYDQEDYEKLLKNLEYWFNDPECIFLTVSIDKGSDKSVILKKVNHG